MDDNEQDFSLSGSSGQSERPSEHSAGEEMSPQTPPSEHGDQVGDEATRSVWERIKRFFGAS
jgi:hypothetical protein